MGIEKATEIEFEDVGTRHSKGVLTFLNNLELLWNGQLLLSMFILLFVSFHVLLFIGDDWPGRILFFFPITTVFSFLSGYSILSVTNQRKEFEDRMPCRFLCKKVPVKYVYEEWIGLDQSEYEERLEAVWEHYFPDHESNLVYLWLHAERRYVGTHDEGN